MFITVLIDYGAKPAGLWHESDRANHPGRLTVRCTDLLM